MSIGSSLTGKDTVLHLCTCSAQVSAWRWRDGNGKLQLRGICLILSPRGCRGKAYPSGSSQKGRLLLINRSHSYNPHCVPGISHRFTLLIFIRTICNRYHDLHFTGKEAGPEKLNDGPRFKGPGNERTGIWTQTLWPQIMCPCLCEVVRRQKMEFHLHLISHTKVSSKVVSKDLLLVKWLRGNPSPTWEWSVTLSHHSGKYRHERIYPGETCLSVCVCVGVGGTGGVAREEKRRGKRRLQSRGRVLLWRRDPVLSFVPGQPPSQNCRGRTCVRESWCLGLVVTRLLPYRDVDPECQTIQFSKRTRNLYFMWDPMNFKQSTSAGDKDHQPANSELRLQEVLGLRIKIYWGSRAECKCLHLNYLNEPMDFPGPSPELPQILCRIPTCIS